jgi:hypothetical protein
MEEGREERMHELVGDGRQTEIVLDVEPRHAPYIVTPLNPRIAVKPDQPLTLDVRIRSYPESTVHWFIDDEEVVMSPTVRLIRKHMNDARAEFTHPRAGLYRLIARNELGEATTCTQVSINRPTPMPLTPKPPKPVHIAAPISKTALQRPRFTVPLKPEYIFDGGQSRIDLRVCVQSEPRAWFEWYVNEQRMANDSRFAHMDVSVINECIASLNDVPVGLYTVDVKAINELGDAWSRCRLVIVEKQDEQIVEEEGYTVDEVKEITVANAPTIIRQLEDTKVANRQRVEFRVDITETSGKCVFVWSIDDCQLTESDTVHINTLDYTSTLVIDAVTADMCGTVSVMVKNEAGYDKSAAVLEIQGESLRKMAV